VSAGYDHDLSAQAEWLRKHLFTSNYPFSSQPPNSSIRSAMGPKTVMRTERIRMQTIVLALLKPTATVRVFEYFVPALHQTHRPESTLGSKRTALARFVKGELRPFLKRTDQN
jgi:hypothetical protein